MISFCLLCVLSLLTVQAQTYPQAEIDSQKIGEQITGKFGEERLKRSPLNIIGTVIKGAKRLMLPGNSEKVRIYEKSGGYQEAYEDFRRLKLIPTINYGSVKIGSNDDIIAKLRYQPAISELVIEKKIRQVVDDEIIDIIKYKNK